MANIKIKRGYEVLSDNNVRFGIRVINNSSFAISDVEVILDYSEDSFKLQGDRIGKLGTIPPSVPRTAKFVLQPKGCIHKEELGATVLYKDHEWNKHVEQMRPKEVHCVCPFLKEKSISRAEFLSLSKSGYSAESGVNFENIDSVKVVDFLSHTCKNRLYKVDEFSVEDGSIMYLAGDAVGEKAYYLLTAVVKEHEGLTQVFLRANSDKDHGLTGFLNETLDNLRHLVVAGKVREIGVIRKEQVINIIDSVVQRTSFGGVGGEGGASVNIQDSVVQRTEFDAGESVSNHKMVGTSVKKHNDWMDGTTLGRHKSFWWKIDDEANITIKRMTKNKNLKTGVEVQIKIIDVHELDLLDEYMAEGDPKFLSHNVVKLANGTEKAGIGKFLFNKLGWLNTETQLASHLGTIFYHAGVWDYNGKKKGIQHKRISDDWRELVTNLYNNSVVQHTESDAGEYKRVEEERYWHEQKEQEHNVRREKEMLRRQDSMNVWEISKSVIEIKTTQFIKTKKEIEKSIFMGLGKKNKLVDIFTEMEIENLIEVRRNTIGMKFALIHAGEFMMGSPPDEKGRSNSEGPVHKVIIRNPFYLSTYPVTQCEWKTVMGDDPSKFKGDDLPVESVSWDDVQKFIKKLNEKEGTDKYRLPSEAEWEYACRAGTTTRYSFGDNKSKLGEYAWHSGNSGSKTNPVGQKKSNQWGLYDMHGNVMECVQDKWHDDYKGAPSDGSAWEDESDSGRVYRGGSWGGGARHSRSVVRLHSDPAYRYELFGFRLLRVP